MSRNALIVLLLLALGLGGGALYVLRDSASAPGSAGSQGATAPTAPGAPLLPQLKAAEVARITIREPKATLTLEKKNERWVITERGGYPADLD